MLLIEGKIRKIEELAEIVKKLKKQNKKIVFTNGCFDVIHSGHLYILEKAKSFGDIMFSVDQLRSHSIQIDWPLTFSRISTNLASLSSTFRTK